MKLLVAQISHQDPLKPMDDTAFVAQLAQFSSLEQMIGVNAKLDTLASGQAGANNAGLATLIGKTVTVSGSTIARDSSEPSTPVNFTLGTDAASVEVNVIDSEGKTIRTMSLGASKAGAVSSQWDGRDNLGAVQANGNYTVSVSAKSASGGAVDVSQETTSTLRSVSYRNGTATLELSNGVSAAAANLIRVDAQNK